MRDRRPHTDPAKGHVPAALHLHKQRVAALRHAGHSIIDLAAADARLTPPRPVLLRLAERLSQGDGSSHYGAVPGIQPLREALAQQLGIPAANLIVTAGANSGVVLALFATTQVGQAVAIPVPYFFNHAAQAELLGLDIVPVQTKAADAHRISSEALAGALARANTAVALVSNPRNPTATRLDETALMALANTGKPVLVDESYREFAPLLTDYPWRRDGNVIRIGSLSKSHGLAGWRIGYIAAPDHLVDDIIRAQDALMIHPAIASQEVALEAIAYRAKDDYVTRFAQEVAAEQTALRTQLARLPWVAQVTGDSATFLWVTLTADADADVFAERLLVEQGIGVLAGSMFGAKEPGFRMGVASVTRADLSEAAKRLAALR